MMDIEEKSVNEVGLEMAEKLLVAQRKKDDDAKFRKHIPYLRRYGIFVSVCLLVAIYLISPYAKLKNILIAGENRLNTAYIRSLTGLDEGSFYDFVSPKAISKKLLKSGFFTSASVTKQAEQSLSVNVQEKKIVGYSYPEDSDTAKILFADQTTVDLKSDYLDLISQVPYISGFDEETMKKITQSMDKVDDEMIFQMAEITRYALSFDANALKILMRNGGYFICDIADIYKINYYNDIYERLQNKQYCIFALDGQNTAYSAVCPWDEAVSEYWTDANGNYILNSAGDKAAKHYYTDASGNPALDQNGNKIPIPLNQNGDEQMDPDFLEHYEEGYYQTGSLVIPG